MKVYTKQSDRTLCNELQAKLAEIRSKRAFSPEQYIKEKTEILNKYMKKCHLSSCVVAVSGGIDSAVVLALVVKAAAEPDSYIHNVMPLLLPCRENSGVVNQSDATTRGMELCQALNVKPYEIEMNLIVKAIQDSVCNALDIEGGDWAIGQLVPYSRTPVLFFTTSLLTQENASAVICGTTNLDEGGYLGYVGKASDGIVDLQLISDIHKSEVFEVAKCLNIPQSILQVTPAGDMYDNRVDEEVFGASYDFVELYLNYLNMNDEEKNILESDLSEYAMEQFKFYQTNIEELHKYNAHKYLSKSPAIHLDLYDSGIKGGWENYRDTIIRFLGE